MKGTTLFLGLVALALILCRYLRVLEMFSLNGHFGDLTCVSFSTSRTSLGATQTSASLHRQLQTLVSTLAKEGTSALLPLRLLPLLLVQRTAAARHAVHATRPRAEEPTVRNARSTALQLTLVAASVVRPDKTVSIDRKLDGFCSSCGRQKVAFSNALAPIRYPRTLGENPSPWPAPTNHGYCSCDNRE